MKLVKSEFLLGINYISDGTLPPKPNRRNIGVHNKFQQSYPEVCAVLTKDSLLKSH